MLPLRQIFHMAEKRDAISFLEGKKKAADVANCEMGWSKVTVRLLHGGPCTFRWLSPFQSYPRW